MSEELELYAYTTETYKIQGLVKVGHCLVGRHVARIHEQFGTSNPEPPEYILVGELPPGYQDKHVHAQLVKNGCKKIDNGPGKEWFRATFDDVKKAYNQIVHGCPRKLNYTLRDEQSAAIEKAKRWFLNNYSQEV